LGNVGGGFQQQTQYPTGLGPDSVAIGDLNGDGRLDLAVANLWTNNVTVLLNRNALADDDFNGDLNSDILWRHDSRQVYIWEMDGLGIKAEGAPTRPSPTTGTSRMSEISTATARATFFGATTTGKSISGRWTAWRSKRRALPRMLRSPPPGTSKASA